MRHLEAAVERDVRLAAEDVHVARRGVEAHLLTDEEEAEERELGERVSPFLRTRAVGGARERAVERAVADLLGPVSRENLSESGLDEAELRRLRGGSAPAVRRGHRSWNPAPARFKSRDSDPATLEDRCQRS